MTLEREHEGGGRFLVWTQVEVGNEEKDKKKRPNVTKRIVRCDSPNPPGVNAHLRTYLCAVQRRKRLVRMYIAVRCRVVLYSVRNSTHIYIDGRDLDDWTTFDQITNRFVSKTNREEREEGKLLVVDTESRQLWFPPLSVDAHTIEWEDEGFPFV